MTESGLSTRRLQALILLAVALRIGAVLALGTWQGGPAAAGAYEHDLIARQILEGHGFAYPFYTDMPEPTATQAPAMPLLLVVVYSLFGVASPGATLAAQLFGVLLAVPAMLGLVWIVRTLGSDHERGRTGDVAAWQAFALIGFALAPPFVYMVTRIQSIVWSTSLLLFVLGLLARFTAQPSAGRGVAAGLAVGVACLGEPILAAPFGLAWCVLVALVLVRARDTAGGRSSNRVGAAAALVPLVAALCVLPWVARNTFALGEPTFIKSSFWYVFWQGNHAGASGTDKLPVEEAAADALRWRLGGGGLEASLEAARRQAVSVDTRLANDEVRALHALPDEAARMAWFGARIRAELSADPAQYFRMVARRLAMLAWFDDTNPRSFALPYRLPYLLLAALALVGIARRGRPRGADWIVAAAAMGLVAALAGIITSARFRLLLEALMILPAARAMVWLLPGLASRVAGGTSRE